jgi:hypothetical protein
MITPGLSLSVFAMLSVLPQLKERALEDVAVIGIPRGIKDEMYKGIRDDQAGRITFTFATSYFWASTGSSTAYGSRSSSRTWRLTRATWSTRLAQET